nr:Predicted dithiol-disulfide isomerase involved in polyketide biosynthesis [uncultured bacterium]
MEPLRGPVRVDVVFDAVCPWCFIGKRRLEQAMRLRPDIPVVRRWRPFLLNPDMPLEGVGQSDYLLRKFGNEARIKRVFGAVSDAGHSAHIAFAFDRIRKTPNTVHAHRLIRFAAGRDRASEAVEALFVNHFINGKDIGDRDVLIRIGVLLGLVEEDLVAYLRSETDIDFIHQENVAAHRLGINAVPSFVFNGNLAISGAQEPRVIARLLDVARESASMRIK